MGRVVRIGDLAGQRYAAAKSPRGVGDWAPADMSVNDLLAMSGNQVRARVRQLVRDFPYFSRAKRVITDWTVNSGFELQSRVVDADGKYLKKISQQIEDAYSRWSDEADISGQLHLKDLQRLSADQESECGEALFILTRSDNPRRFLPLALQMVESDWLASYATQAGTGDNDVAQGVEYNRRTGERIAYHFADPTGYNLPQRIPAAKVIHPFETLRPGQLRGISPFVPGVLITRDLQDCIEGEVDGFKYASKWLAFVKSMNPMEAQAKRGTEKIEELENGIIEYLNAFEDVTLASNPRGTNLDPFVRLVLSMISVATGVPYELLSGDYRNLNMAVTKVVRADFRHSVQPLIARRIRQVCKPIFRAFLDEAVLHGRLDLPGYWKTPWVYERAMWFPPVPDPVDRLRDAKADIEEMDSLLRSPQEICAARGRQYEDVLAEIDEAEQMAKKHGLTKQKVSTALANNPQAVAKEE